MQQWRMKKKKKKKRREKEGRKKKKGKEKKGNLLNNYWHIHISHTLKTQNLLGSICYLKYIND